MHTVFSLTNTLNIDIIFEILGWVMNVLDLLTNELKDKNWTTEEKARYLYLKSCELFSYDKRYNFSNLEACERFCFSKITNRQIDLENVTDNRVICKSHAREVISKIMLEILGIECRDLGRGHSWTTFNDGKRNVEADATISSDLARVKMGLNTKGYRPNEKEYFFYEKLKEIDKTIGYIKTDYENTTIEEEIKKLKTVCDELENNDEVLIEKLYTIKSLFENYKNLTDFSDSEFCISYLIKRILNSNLGLDRTSLVIMKDNGYWDFINIYPFYLENEVIYFVLRTIDNKNYFYEITESEVFELLKKYPGTNKKMVLTTNKIY